MISDVAADIYDSMQDSSKIVDAASLKSTIDSWTKWILGIWVTVAVLPFFLSLGGLAIGAFAVLAAGNLVVNWPFLIVLWLGRRKLERSWPDISRAKHYIRGAIVGLILPNLITLIGSPQEFASGAPDAGQGTGIWMAVELIILPLFGLLGWYVGALVGWLSHRRAVSQFTPSSGPSRP